MNKTLKKTLSIILTILMIATTVPVAFAANTPVAYDGVPVTPQKITSSNYVQYGLTESNWSQYNGYYGIRNAKELYGFANLVNGMNNVYCSQTNAVLLQDIVVNTTVSESGAAYSWTPIGTATISSADKGSPYFTGTFDGNGHTISGLYANGTGEHIGLFGATGYSNTAVIKNVVLANSYFSGSQYVGGIVGYAFWNDTTISNCKVSSDVTVQASGKFVGGIIGGSYMLDSVDLQYGGFEKDNQVINCVNFGTVKTTASTNAVGGIAGAWAKETDYMDRLITVKNSYYLKGCVSNAAGTVSWACGTYVENGSGWADNTGSTALNSADASHTCISVEHKETVANCTYPGLSNYSFCLICGTITSGTKTVTPTNGTHFYTGGNCTTAERCVLCGGNGSKHPDTHASTRYTNKPNETDSTKHDVYYSCCGALVRTEEHGTALRYTKVDEETHSVYYTCCGGFKETVNHNYVDSVCTLCEYKCTHSVLDGDSCAYCGSNGIYYLNREWNGTKVVEERKITNGMPTVVTSSTTTMNSGWYVVNGNVDVSDRITISGTVHLLLADNATLNAKGGIQLLIGNTLYIYATSSDEQTIGKLFAKARYLGETGIGARSAYENPGTLIINGGYVSATASDGAAGIGGYGHRDYSSYGATGDTLSLTVNGGQVVATGGHEAAGIGGGYGGNGGTVNIHGGTVIATSGGAAAAIGGGREGDGGNVTINGGNINAIGWGIGGGFCGSGGTLQNGDGSSVSLKTLTLDGAVANTAVTAVEGTTYGVTDVTTLDTNKLYFYLPADTEPTSITAGGKEYVCNQDLTYYTEHAEIEGTTCSMLGTCTRCGKAAGVVDPNAHAVSERWSYENGYHYYECLYGCGAILDKSACSGSEATCLEPAVCETCGNSYGEKNMDNHVSADTYYELIDNNEHGLYNSCCGTLIETGAHDDDAAEATCVGVAKCSVCNADYGSKASANHTGVKKAVIMNSTSHRYVWECCNVNEPVENHNLVYTADEDTDTISAVCSDCDANGTYTMNINSGTYNGYNFTASYSGTDIFQYSYNSLVKPTFDYCCDEGCTKAGDHVATMTLDDATVSADFTIDKKPLTLKEVQVAHKSYDGSTALQPLNSPKLDGVVIYSKGYYTDDDYDFDDVRDDVKVDTWLMEINAPDCVPDDYETVSVTNIKLIGEDADNYTIEESYDSVPVRDWVGLSGVTIEQPRIWIDAEDQVLEGDEELDQTAYEISGLAEQFKIEGIELYENANRVEIDTENLTITLNDEDVTDYFIIETFGANLLKVCEGHITDDYGLCSTGTCESYEAPYKVSEIDEYGNEIVLWYEIANAGQLYWYAKQVNDYGMQFTEAKLVNDIEIPATVSNGGTAPDWTPINYLYATFDGQGYSISGLYVDSEENYVGLFGQHNSYDVKDLTIKESYFKGNKYVGAIAGYTDGVFKNCFVDSSVTVIGTEAVGGLIGQNNGFNAVTNCMSLASVKGEDDVGGLIGYNRAAIKNCYTTADSLVGSHSTYYDCEITNSYYLADEDTDEIDGTTAKTEEQFASGEVAYLLQSGIVEEDIYDEEGNYVETVTPHVWGQDSNQAGATPIFDSTGLYKVVKIGDTGNYSVANVGDTNGDGTVDVEDYQALVNKALADDHEQIETAEYDDIVRYDLDGDGYLDVLDVSLMERMINGHKTADVYAVGDYDLNGVAFEEADILAMAEAMENPEDLATYQKYACDLNADGVIDILDLIEVNNLQK